MFSNLRQPYNSTSFINPARTATNSRQPPAAIIHCAASCKRLSLYHHGATASSKAEDKY